MHWSLSLSLLLPLSSGRDTISISCVCFIMCKRWVITQKSLLSPSASLIPVIIMSLVYILPLPFPEVTPCYMFHIQIHLNDISWLQHYIKWKYLRHPAHPFKHIHTNFSRDVFGVFVNLWFSIITEIPWVWTMLGYMTQLERWATTGFMLPIWSQDIQFHLIVATCWHLVIYSEVI